MALLLSNAEMPTRDAIATPPSLPPGQKFDPKKGMFATQPWIEWWTRVSTSVEQAPAGVGVTRLTNQSASIPLTDFSGGTVGTGLYRLSYYVRVTRPASVSSSIAFAFAWTDDGEPQSASSGAAVTGNTVQTWLSGSIVVELDGATPVEFTTTYASVGGTAMLYKASVSLELLRG